MSIAIRLVTPGPITIYLTLDEGPPYYFIAGGRQVRELRFMRRFPSSGDYTTSFTFSLVGMRPESTDPSLIVRAAGIDGSSLPVKAHLEMHR